MFQNRQKVCVVTSGDPSRVIKVQAGTGDPSRVPVVTTDGVLGRDQQVQVVVGGDSARFPILNGVNPILALSPAAYYQFGVGVTEAGGFASQWDDQSGNGRHLIQLTGTNQPAYSAGIFTFDGVDNYMTTAPFTLNQPTTVYLVAKALGWTDGDSLCDGNAINTGKFQQSGATPNVSFYAGNYLTGSLSVTVDTEFVISAVWNGASGSAGLNDGTRITGNCGASNMGGFTLGAGGNNLNYAYVAVKEAAIFAASHDASTRTQIISFLMAKFSIT